ncbi:MAG: flagellar brake protein [Vulcanimicrobiaceae bacterium]
MIFKALFSGKRSAIPASKLPIPDSFVDVFVGGRPSRSVTVESVGPKVLVTREALGRAGEMARFIYATPAGRFRFGTRIVGVSGQTTTFELPRQVELVAAASGAQKRSSVRLDALVPGYWRYAPNGKGVGEFAKGNVRDISRGGCSLIADRQFKLGQTVEVKLQLSSTGVPLVLLGEVMRAEPIPTSGKHSHGLRFQAVTAQEDHAIMEFINRRQAELRNRGLV